MGQSLRSTACMQPVYSAWNFMLTPLYFLLLHLLSCSPLQLHLRLTRLAPPPPSPLLPSPPLLNLLQRSPPPLSPPQPRPPQPSPPPLSLPQPSPPPLSPPQPSPPLLNPPLLSPSLRRRVPSLQSPPLSPLLLSPSLRRPVRRPSCPLLPLSQELPTQQVCHVLGPVLMTDSDQQRTICRQQVVHWPR
jgi:hypothetical protein